jgi:plastocyanin
VDASKAGVVAGRVRIDGSLPANAPIRMAADPVCIRANTAEARLETFVGENGGVGNVFVYIKDGLGSYWVDVPAETVTLDQTACRYTPHVVGVRAGQPLEIGNGDETLHNVHGLSAANGDFNFSQQMKGLKNRKVFDAPEVMITLKCDVHPWMNAYVGVVNHPYFAVTPAGGTFELKNVPAGTYTIEAWHEKLGTATQPVTIGEKETKTVEFTFKPAA